MNRYTFQVWFTIGRSKFLATLDRWTLRKMIKRQRRKERSGQCHFCANRREPGLSICAECLAKPVPEFPF